MSDAENLHHSLLEIAEQLSDDMSERDVENLFLESGFYHALGYEGTGTDIRSEFTLPDDRRPDYVTLDSNEAVTAVFEFKKPSRDLSPHTDQLFHYINELKARYGVLTNGQELRLYRRDGHERYITVALAEVTDSVARDLASALRKPKWDVTSPDHVSAYLDELEPVGLDSKLGQEHFFDTFRLAEASPFANLVTALMDMLHELRDDQEATFARGAYDFWEASYAAEPDNNIPDSWRPFIDGSGSLLDFMFCLESGHALLARLLLAKASEDHDFFPHSRGLRRYFDELGGFSSEIRLDAYPGAALSMIEEMRGQLVESLFEDDIFIWWKDPYLEATASLHASPFSRFQDLAEEGSKVTRVSPATQERFSRAMAHVIFSVLKFDFSRIEGDPLGDLYQRYFDPETRKALGEFYTPQPVVEYIMDAVGYDVGVSSERLIDPACGSGTFLVEAVERYLKDVRRYQDDPDWARHLRELCTRPRIVGLDIHPFAVLMAQIRFMVAILPAYREAKRLDESFTIRRLPIFRTDSLRNERELTGIDLDEDGATQMTWDALTEDGQDVRIPVPLPIEVDPNEVEESEREGKFLRQFVRMPLFDTIRRHTGIENFGEYYAALQGVLDVVKWYMNEETFEYGGGLSEGIDRYTTRKYEGLDEFFAPYVEDILETVKLLREDHGDGRLFKMFEDTVLSLVVKNYMKYDYVVGNPPYVNIRTIPKRDQARYDKLYDSAYYRYDLYVLFIERGLEWLTENGKFGFITSNKFTRSRYGQEIRRIISSKYSLDEYIELGDIDVFTDATNFASILIIDRDHSREMISYAKVHQGKENIFDEIRSYLGSEDILTESLEISTYPRSELTEETWQFVPEKVRRVFKKLQREANTTIGETALGVREGVKSGGDEVFIVSPDEAERFDLENELLMPLIRGKNVRRWHVKWDNELLIYPYKADGVLVDIREFPNIKAYLENNEDYLKDRYCVRENDKEIYEFHGHHSKSVFEGDFKIATPDMATENHFAYTDQFECFVSSVYVLTFSDDQPYDERTLLGFLNSSIAELVVKQSSPPLRGKPFRYRYQSDHVNKIPLVKSDTQIEELVSNILDAEKLEHKTVEFPETYLDDVTGEIQYIEYKWETDRSPVEANLQELADDRFAVQAGRSDSIKDPRMESPNREDAIRRAEYVLAAVDGRYVESGEEQSIPIPRHNQDIAKLLAAWEQDRSKVESTNIEELESEIDQLVYELFNLTDEETEVIEEYLDVF